MGSIDLNLLPMQVLKHVIGKIVDYSNMENDGSVLYLGMVLAMVDYVDLDMVEEI